MVLGPQPPCQSPTSLALRESLSAHTLTDLFDSRYLVAHVQGRDRGPLAGWFGGQIFF